jgi:hypothetical protein
MINFRFHIVSLVAVFLALAVGILFGSAFGKPTLIENLNKELNRVENKADAEHAASAQLRTAQQHLDDYIRGSAPYMVQDRLPGYTVVVVAQRGVSDKTVSSTLDLLHSAGADAAGIVWLEPRWQLTAPGDLAKLAAAVGTNAQGADSVRAVALGTLADRLSGPLARGATNPQQQAQADVLRRLADAGFVTVSGVSKSDFATFPVRSTRAALVIGGDQSKFVDPTLYGSVVHSFVNADVPTVAAEAFANVQNPNALERGDIVAPVLADSTLSKQVSTVDDVDLTQGQVTTVLALEDLVTGNVVGHYGFGKGATSSVPAPPTS